MILRYQALLGSVYTVKFRFEATPPSEAWQAGITKQSLVTREHLVRKKYRNKTANLIELMQWIYHCTLKLNTNQWIGGLNLSDDRFRFDNVQKVVKS
jgi:hypothetical protein